MGSPITQTLSEPAGTEMSVITMKPLSRSDRCDRCNAQGFVAVHEKATGFPLIFCGNHYFRLVEPILGDNPQWIIQDERHKINEKPSVSANAD